MTGERYDRFDDFVQQYIVSASTARIKLWAKDGTLIYSDDPERVGRIFPGHEGRQKALRREIAVEIMVPGGPEHEGNTPRNADGGLHSHNFHGYDRTKGCPRDLPVLRACGDAN